MFGEPIRNAITTCLEFGLGVGSIVRIGFRQHQGYATLDVFALKLCALRVVAQTWRVG
jgi:hypothetical protein